MFTQCAAYFTFYYYPGSFGVALDGMRRMT